MRPIPVLLASLLTAAVLAGCSEAPTSDAATGGTGTPLFDVDDPRLPTHPDGLPAGAVPTDAAALAFPVFSPAAWMNGSAGAHRETSLAIGPAGSPVRFACDPSGVPNTQEGQSIFYLSVDNGTTWAEVAVETPRGPGWLTDPRGLAFEGGDCDVAIGPEGLLWTADTWLGSLSVGMSADNGQTWRGTMAAASSPVVDRPWLATDASGVLHLTYQDVQALMPSAIWYTRVVPSEAGPLVFQPAVLVTSANAEGGFTWTGNLVVSADGGSLWSVYTRRQGPVTNDLEGSGPETVWVAASTDGGMTWTQHLVSQRPAPASFLYPSIGLDAGGFLHVVFAQAADGAHPVFHSVSTDAGATWSEPAVVRHGVAAYSPWVAGGLQAGSAAIQWYGSPEPDAKESGNATWFTYWATVTGAGTANTTYLSATTTEEPLFTGEQGETPEFNMVRVDGEGRIHIGASVRVDTEDDFDPWGAVYQVQEAGSW